MHREIQKGQNYTFEWEFYNKNIQEVPVSGTISVYSPGSSTAIVDGDAVSVETDGTIKYTLLGTLIDTCDKNYKIELTYQVGDVITRPFYLFTVVETPLVNQVRDEDIFHYAPDLRDKVASNVIETTSEGSTTTFISTEMKPLNIDFKGGYAEIYIDDTTVHDVEITAYDSETGTATFTPAYGSAIATAKRVSLRSSYQRYIDDAFEQFVYRDIRNKVPLSSGYIDSTVTDNLTIFKALEIICFGLSEDDNDKWDRRANKFTQSYKDEYVKLNEAYDINEDGTIDGDENANRPNFTSVGIVR